MNATTISLSISGIMCVIGILTFILSRVDNARKKRELDLQKKESEVTKLSEINESIRAQTESSLRMNVKMDQIAKDASEIRLDMKEINNRQRDIEIRVSKMEEKYGSLYDRVDELKRCKG